MRRGFTLVELLVAVGLFLLAITVAISATIGANNLIARAEARAAVVEGARTLTDQVRRLAANAKPGDIVLEGNEVIVFRGFSPDQAANVCTYIGLARYSFDEQLGTENFEFTGDGRDTLAAKTYKLLENNVCSELIYQGRLTEPGVEALALEFSKIVPAGCGNSCAFIRYKFTLRESGIAQSAETERRRATLEIISSAAIGLEL